MQRAARKHWTWDDYVKMPEDGKRYEIIEGDLIVLSGPSLRHQRALGRLYLLVNAWSRSGVGGDVVLAPIDVELAYDIVLQPDLIWIAPDRIAEIEEHHVRGIPDLVVEVLSPSTARRDRVRKAAIYARYGAQEYWLIDPVAERVEMYRHERHRFHLHAAGGGDDVLGSSIDRDLSVVPADLFRPLDPPSRGLVKPVAMARTKPKARRSR